MRILTVIIILTCLLIPMSCGKNPVLSDFQEASSTNKWSNSNNFTLNDLNGLPVALNNYSGQVILVVFWATWCGYCVAEIPTIKALQTEFAAKPFKILAVDDMESQSVVQSFCTTNGITYTVLLDTTGAVLQQYNVTGIPTCVIFDKFGNINKTLVGTHPADTDILPLL